jgi:catecholate siderophore receptor
VRDSSDRSAPAGAARFLALGCIGLIAGTAPALAQDAGTADPQGQRVLGAVTVTDTAITEGSYKTERAASPKYTAPLLDTPRTITVIPSQVLQDNATASLADALRFVPGITLGAGEGGNPGRPPVHSRLGFAK